MALKGKTPEIADKRLKLFVYGDAGVGKTWAAIGFPKAYIIDTERGTDWYSEKIKKQGSVVFQTHNPDDIKTELVSLLTEKHEYRTLVIDPMTQVYHALQEKWTRIFEKYATNTKEKELQDFGMRYWNKVKGDHKAITRLLFNLDMNVIVTSHQKDVYGVGFTKMGVTYDSMKGENYAYDVTLHLEKQGEKRIANKIKERAEPDKQKFPDAFPWSYDAFLKFWGRETIEREAKPTAMATADQIKRLNLLVETLKTDDETIGRWLSKAGVETFDEMKSEDIEKCTLFLDKKLAELKK